MQRQADLLLQRYATYISLGYTSFCFCFLSSVSDGVEISLFINIDGSTCLRYSIIHFVMVYTRMHVKIMLAECSFLKLAVCSSLFIFRTDLTVMIFVIAED